VATFVFVTAKGREVIVNRLGATGGSEPKQLGWGTGTQTAATTDVGPFIEAPEARVTGTSSVVTTTTTNDTYQVVGTITCTQGGGETIAEVFLSDSATKPFSTTWSTAPTTTSGTTGTTAASYTPANNTYIQVESEVMQVTAGTGTTSLTVTRAQNGSSAATHSNGTTLTLGNPPGTATANATLFLHASFTGLALSNGDSLQSTVQVKFT
jgi:hypothetical protein